MDYVITNTDLIDFFIIAVGIGVSVLGIAIINNSSVDKQAKKYFTLFFTFLSIYIGTNLVLTPLMGHPGPVARAILQTVEFFEFYTSVFMPSMIMLLITGMALDKDDIVRIRITRFIYGLLAIHTVIEVIAHFNHFYYYFDEANVYHRATYNLVSYIGPVLVIILSYVVLVRYRTKFKRNVRIALWIYMSTPFIGIVLNVTIPVINWIILATVICSTYMFIVITNDLKHNFENQSVETSRIESELSLASRIQESVIPAVFPAFPDRTEFDLYGSMTPAKKVGGDFYDFFMVDDDHLALVMADVSGKGIPGAMFMMFSKNIIANNVMLGKNPARALADANAAICKNNAEEMFVTVWLGVLEISTGKLTCANGGHEYPFFKLGDEFALYKDKHGFSVGWFDDSEYTEYEIQLNPGDRLFVYTDGVPEATNGSGEMYGTDRALAVLNRDKDSSCEKLLKDIWEDVGVFVGEAEQFDDLTMLALEYRG